MKLINWIINLFCKKVPDVPSSRRTGKTTRLVDKYVQEFFTKGSCTTYDHYGSKEANKRLFYLVLDRLSKEHDIEKKPIRLNMRTFTIINLKK